MWVSVLQARQRGETQEEEPLPRLSASQRAVLKRCWKKYGFKYIDRLEPRGATPKNLWFGIGVHEALAGHYGLGRKRGEHPAHIFERWAEGERPKIKIYAERFEADEKVYLDAIELGVIMLTEYVKEYGADEQWDVIATEKAGVIKIPGPNGSVAARFSYVFDGVVRDLETGRVWLIEHKTASQINTDHLTLDEQAGSYWAIASSVLRHQGVLGPRESIAGIMYNFLRKTTPDDRPRHPITGERLNKPTKAHIQAYLASLGIDHHKNATVPTLEALVPEGHVVLGDVSASQPTPAFVRYTVRRNAVERRTQIERIGQEADLVRQLRSGTLPLIKTPRQSGFDACKWCDYFQMCELDERGADWETYRDAMYNVRPPSDEPKSAYQPSN